MKFAQSIILICFLGLSTLTGCSSIDTPSPDGITNLKNSFPVITATGYSIVNIQPGKTHDQKVLQAMRASKLDAYRELSEQLYGLQIDSTTTLRDIVQTDSHLEASVSGLVRGAKVVRTYPLSKNVYATELQLDTKLLYRLYEIRGTL
ncbi:MAG: LPP20 family lipoprotein [Succinivibrionaceae bacterium]|jgi:hypothetical protein|nr:LPP20 family lipoprotein [Succinivibrionaceae bacterium]